MIPQTKTFRSKKWHILIKNYTRLVIADDKKKSDNDEARRSILPCVDGIFSLVGHLRTKE